MQDTSQLEEGHAAEAEHAAWRRAMAEWDRLKLGDINGERFNRLVKAIEAWGENLVALRLWADQEDREKWLGEAERAYKKARG